MQLLLQVIENHLVFVLGDHRNSTPVSKRIGSVSNTLIRRIEPSLYIAANPIHCPRHCVEVRGREQLPTKVEADEPAVYNQFQSAPMFPTLPPRSASLKWCETVLFAVNASVAFLGNFLVCLAVYRSQNLRSTTNIYIAALAISDILTALFCQTLATGVWASGRWIYGEIACDIYGFFAHFLIYVSVWTMALTAINRFFRVVKHHLYRKIFTRKFSLLVIGATWAAIAFLVLLPVLAGLGEFRFLDSFGGCGWYFPSSVMNAVFNSLQVSLFSVIPSVVIIVCYLKVYRAIRAHNANIARNAAQPGISGEEIRITKTLAALVLGFALCWIPSFSIVLLSRIILSNTPHEVSFVASFLLALSSAINPFIYGAMNTAFRGEFTAILCRRGPRSRDNSQDLAPTFRVIQEPAAPWTQHTVGY